MRTAIFQYVDGDYLTVIIPSNYDSNPTSWTYEQWDNLNLQKMPLDQISNIQITSDVPITVTPALIQSKMTGVDMKRVVDLTLIADSVQVNVPDNFPINPDDWDCRLWEQLRQSAVTHLYNNPDLLELDLDCDNQVFWVEKDNPNYQNVAEFTGRD